jgi:hypothetical protein
MASTAELNRQRSQRDAVRQHQNRSSGRGQQQRGRESSSELEARLAAEANERHLEKQARARAWKLSKKEEASTRAQMSSLMTSSLRADVEAVKLAHRHRRHQAVWEEKLMNAVKIGDNHSVNTALSNGARPDVCWVPYCYAFPLPFQASPTL